MAATAAMPLYRASARLSNFVTPYAIAIGWFYSQRVSNTPVGFKILFIQDSDSTANYQPMSVA
jgi:hypothetical protein